MISDLNSYDPDPSHRAAGPDGWMAEVHSLSVAISGWACARFCAYQHSPSATSNCESPRPKWLQPSNL
jgi:hypothetical protein